MFDIARVPVARQKVVGDALAGVVPAADAKASKKGEALPEEVLALGREVLTRTRALELVASLPKLAIDNTADRVFGGYFKILLGEAQCLDGTLSPLSSALEARRRAAVLVRTKAYKKGVRVLKLEMSQQYQEMRGIVLALRSPELVESIKVLGHAHHVDHLEAQLAPYGVAVKAPNGDDLEKLSDAWHAAFTRFVAAVVSKWPEGHATREALLKPYQRELDAQRAEQAAARKATRKRKADTQ